MLAGLERQIKKSKSALLEIAKELPLPSQDNSEYRISGVFRLNDISEREVLLFQ